MNLFNYSNKPDTSTFKGKLEAAWRKEPPILEPPSIQTQMALNIAFNAGARAALNIAADTYQAMRDRIAAHEAVIHPAIQRPLEFVVDDLRYFAKEVG